MEQLHHRLKQRSAWYRFWHDQPHHQTLHWIVLILVAGLFAALLMLRLSGSPLQSRPSDAAAESVTLRPGESKVVRDVQVTYNLPLIRKFFFISDKPSFTFSRAGRTATVGLGSGQSVRLFNDTVQATNIGQGKNSAVTLEMLITTPAVELFIDKGFDPGMTKRLIATIHPSTRGYYENCPDAPQAKCYGNISAGGGFYTLSPSALEDANQLCKINSAELFTVPFTGNREPCPYYFNWTTDSSGRVAANTSIDTRDWSDGYTPNLWNGFQQNTQYGGLYMGANNMPNINEAYYESWMAASVEGLRTDTSARTRFITGVAWYAPALNKSYVLELNLSAVNESQQPEWSTTVEAIQNRNCSDGVVCLYLGGRYWRLPDIKNSTPQKVSVDWSAIVSQLARDGYLPQGAVGAYPLSAVYSGPELLGWGKSSLQISGATIKAKINQ